MAEEPVLWQEGKEEQKELAEDRENGEGKDHRQKMVQSENRYQKAQRTGKLWRYTICKLLNILLSHSYNEWLTIVKLIVCEEGGC